MLLFDSKWNVACADAVLRAHRQAASAADIIPLISVTSRGKWKVRNLRDNDYILGLNCHFGTIYHSTPDSEQVAKHFKAIINTLTKLSRPDKTIREKHVSNVSKSPNRV